jgi:hypothetical protein
MLSSSVKGLQNEIKNLENESSFIISTDKYYIVKIEYTEGNAEGDVEDKGVKKIAEEFLCSDPQPLSVQIFSDKLLLLFSCVEESQQHFQGGDISLIISYFVHAFSNKIKCKNITARTIHFQTQTQIFAYFAYVIFNHSQNVMIEKSNGSITQKELQFLTENELINLLDKNSQIKWNDIPQYEKYGSLLRLRSKKGKMRILEMTEIFDARNAEKYIKFIF